MPVITLGGVRSHGAIVELAVGPSAPQAMARKRAGLPPIYPKIVSSLLDTGAKTSCIDPSLIEELGLEPRGEISINVPSLNDPQIIPLYDVQVSFTRPKLRTAAESLPVAALDLAHLDVLFLLGRDLLSRCLVVYNGPADEFAFSY